MQRIFVFLGLLLSFIGCIVYLVDSAPEAKRKKPKAPIPLVDVIPAKIIQKAITIRSYGTIKPTHLIQVRSQVGGKIIKSHSELEPGGIIPANQPMVKIEPLDYELVVAGIQADIIKAKADIELEQGRRQLAQADMRSLKKTALAQQSQDLILREPQLRQVQAALAQVQQRLRQATLDLQRTSIRFPFDVVVLNVHRVVGEILAKSELVATVARADQYWLHLDIPLAQLSRLQVRQGNQPGSIVKIKLGGITYQGDVIRIRPDLQPQSRLAQVIAEFDRLSEKPRLLLQQYVEAEVDAGILTDVVMIPRRALRNNQRVWIVDSAGYLQIKTVAIVWQLKNHILLKPQFDTHDQIVVSQTAGLLVKSKVRTRQYSNGKIP